MGPFRCGQEFKVIFLKNNAFQKCLQRTLENSLFSIFITEEKKNQTKVSTPPTFSSSKKKNKSLCCLKMKVKVAQLCPALCDPMDYKLLRILQARILEWVAVSFFRESSQLRDWTQVSHIAGRFFISWATREALSSLSQTLNLYSFLFSQLGGKKLP